MKIQALAVAAASFAVAAPALPAQAGSVYEQAKAACHYMRQGYGARQAVRRAVREISANGDHFGAMVMDICGPTASAAIRRDKRAEINAPSTPRYSGGNTTISEDPFEF